MHDLDQIANKLIGELGSYKQIREALDAAYRLGVAASLPNPLGVEIYSVYGGVACTVPGTNAALFVSRFGPVSVVSDADFGNYRKHGTRIL